VNEIVKLRSPKDLFGRGLKMVLEMGICLILNVIGGFAGICWLI
jgi:hypothetical protein